VAVRPSAEALAHAAAAVDEVRAAEPGPRWVPAERWHLTLAFYGEVDDRELPEVTRRIDRGLVDVPPMTLSIAGAGSFSRRAVWLGVVGDVEVLQRAAYGVAFEDRAYQPHLTVARLRGGTDPTAAVAALSSYAGPVWTVDEVHLVRSQLGPRPAYDDIETWPLAAPSEGRRVDPRTRRRVVLGALALLVALVVVGALV
jgi:2'-5' RNA ligase